jgi:ATP-dependent Lhr-like helicase
VFPDAACSPELTDLPQSAPRFGESFDAESATVEIVRGWMDCVGPTTSSALATRLTLPPAGVDAALARLEADGVVLRGQFTSRDPASELEWCERGLLARIHRMTLGRLRKEIEAVSAADFIRFLFRWQNVQPGTQLHGRDGIRRIVGQLQGLELPGPAWERDILPARIAQYSPADLEQLCLAGEVAWGRLKVTLSGEEEAGPPLNLPRPAGKNTRGGRRRQAPTRAAPLAFFLRESMADLVEPLPEGRQWVNELSPVAVAVLEHLERRGASFLADIARAVRHLPTEVEDALWELVASGLVTGDGIAGLRTLLLPEKDRQSRKPKRGTHLRSIPGRGTRRLMPVGRWSLLHTEAETAHDMNEAAELAAQRLLKRYGVVLRDLCARERRAPSWRYLLPALRRMEARGQVRGGRFVAGFVGEQFALPEAVETLRSVRKKHDGDELVIVAAADPLNVAGILTPGAKVSPFSGQFIAYRNGVPIEIGELGAVRSKLQAHTTAAAPRL